MAAATLSARRSRELSVVLPRLYSDDNLRQWSGGEYSRIVRFHEHVASRRNRRANVLFDAVDRVGHLCHGQRFREVDLGRDQDLVGTDMHGPKIQNRRDGRFAHDRAGNRIDVGITGRFPDEQSFGFDRQHDGDDDQQNSDGDGTDGVPTWFVGVVSQHHSAEREDQSGFGADVFEKNHREFGLFRCANESHPGHAGWFDMSRLFDGGAQGKRLQGDGNQQDRDGDRQFFGFVGMRELLDSLVQGEESTHGKENESDDEGPEVSLSSVTELELAIGPLFGALRAENEQCLVAGVGQRVAGFGEKSGGTCQSEADELRDSDTQVGEERRNDRFSASILHDDRMSQSVGRDSHRRGTQANGVGWTTMNTMSNIFLTGRVALVSGGGRGIGRGISELLASHGASIAVNYRNDRESAEETVRAITDAGGVARAYGASVDDADAVAAMVDNVVADFGGIDILVCNAGVASRGRSVADTDPTEVQRLLATHAVGPHHMARCALPSMRTRGRGDIVMISSVATSHMSANGAPYSMGKAAMEALAMTLAKEERQFGIHVNVVAPGLVETDMGLRLARAMTGQKEMADLRALDKASPFGRVCQPLDVANVVLWLCSDGAGYVTGQRIECDGGGPR